MWRAGLFATGLTLLSAFGGTTVQAMALSAPAALKPAADSIRPVEAVYCGYDNGCGGYGYGAVGYGGYGGCGSGCGGYGYRGYGYAGYGYGGCGGCSGYGYTSYAPYYYPRPYVYRPYYPYVRPHGSFYRPYVGYGVRRYVGGYGVRPYVGGYGVRYGYRSRFYGPRRWY